MTLSLLSNFAANVAGAMGLVVLLYYATLNRSLIKALAFALDFWLAAGLLKLVGHPSWKVILTSGIIVVLRKILTLNLNATYSVLKS